MALFVPLAALGMGALAVATALLLGVGIWAAGVAERVYARQDDGRIVIDEVVGQLLTLAPLLVLAPAAVHSPVWLVTGFVVFRVLDIWKPGPVRGLERSVRGGTGVMLDDVGAGALGAGVLAVPLWLLGARS